MPACGTDLRVNGSRTLWQDRTGPGRAVGEPPGGTYPSRTRMDSEGLPGLFTTPLTTLKPGTSRIQDWAVKFGSRRARNRSLAERTSI